MKQRRSQSAIATYDNLPWEMLNSSGSSWMIINPLNKENEKRSFTHDYIEGSEYSTCKPINDSIKSTYKGLNEIIYKEHNLSVVTEETVDRIIFEELEKMREITLSRAENA